MKAVNLTGKTVLILLIAGFLVSTLSLQAQNKKKYKEMFKELHQQMQDFRKENIHPQMLEWKEKLDNAMETDDLAKLNELRAKAGEFRSKMQEFKHDMREKHRDGEFDRDEMKEKMKEHKAAMKEHKKEMREIMKPIMEELKPLAEKYMSTLEEIQASAEVKKEEWKEATKEMMDAWKENHESELENLKEHKKGKRFGKMHMRMTREKHMEFELDDPRSVARFMLWDGTLPEPPAEPESQAEIMGAESDQAYSESFRNYPNPFSEKTTIFFTLVKESQVKLEVYDNMGKKITTIFNGDLPSGEHSFIFNANSSKLKELPSGTYIYKLTSENSTKSGKMVLNR